MKKVINPYTNKYISVGGSTYKKVRSQIGGDMNCLDHIVECLATDPKSIKSCSKNCSEYYNKYFDAAMQINTLAKQIDNDLGLTKFLEDYADKYDGELMGVEFKFKSVPRILQKLIRLSKDYKIHTVKDLEKVLDKLKTNIKDALRFTVVLDDDSYVEGTKSILQQLENNPNFSIYKNKNFWKLGNNYQGINSNIKYSNGLDELIWELQFHTPTSFHVKMAEISHKLYEYLQNQCSNGSDEVICDMSNNVLLGLEKISPIPKNVLSIGTLV